MTLQRGSRPVPNCPDYVLIRKLGAGAFGQVWHAHGPGGLDVALKFIPLNARVRAVELRSLEVMKSIRHPNLVSLFGYWDHDNCLILAMELCDRTLQERLIEALDQDLPGIPLKELLSCMSDAANGLDALNKQAQHRDVKPANLLLLSSGVKVADFGLAKALEQTVASNSGAGTLAYTAPECFKGELTRQSDQYSLAVTYYHLRTGELLFKGNQAQVTYAHLELEPDLSQLPAGEGAVLARALSKEPGKRWGSCKGFVEELIGATNPFVSSGIVDLAESLLLKASEAIRGMAWLGDEGCDNAIKDFDEAIQLFSQAIRLNPQNACAYCNRGKAWLGSDEAWRDEKACNKAIKDFSEAIRLDPVNACAYVERGKAYVQRNRNHSWEEGGWEEEDCDNAIKDYNQAIRLDPKLVEAYQERGKAWFEKRDFDKAIKDHDEVIRLDPRNAYAYHNRGKAMLGKTYRTKKGFDKDCENAIKYFDQAIRLRPTDASFFYERGDVRASMKEFDEAVKDYDEAIRLQPKFLLAYIKLADLLATCREEKVRSGRRAIQMATKACELTNWRAPWALATLAAAYAEAAQFDKAEDYQMKALENANGSVYGSSPPFVVDKYRRLLELYKQKKLYHNTT